VLALPRSTYFGWGSLRWQGGAPGGGDAEVVPHHARGAGGGERLRPRAPGGGLQASGLMIADAGVAAVQPAVARDWSGTSASSSTEKGAQIWSTAWARRPRRRILVWWVGNSGHNPRALLRSPEVRKSGSPPTRPAEKRRCPHDFRTPDLRTTGPPWCTRVCMYFDDFRPTTLG